MCKYQIFTFHREVRYKIHTTLIFAYDLTSIYTVSISIQRLGVMLFVHNQNSNTLISSLNFFSFHQSFHSFYFLLQFFFFISISRCLRCIPTSVLQKNISKRLVTAYSHGRLTMCVRFNLSSQFPVQKGATILFYFIFYKNSTQETYPLKKLFF